MCPSYVLCRLWIALGESLPQLSNAFLAYSRDAVGRLTNSSLSVGGAPVASTAYSFDNAGRLSSVSDGMNTATYTYGPDGSLWTNLSFGAALNTSRTFDGLNRLTSILSASPTSVVSSSSYYLNAANQRTTNSLADGGHWGYQYDSLGQVISGKKYFADGQPVQGAQFEFTFDTIGNRTSGGRAGPPDPPSYTANNLNQYSQRDVPGVVELTGSADPAATIAVRDGVTNAASYASRHGDYFWQDLAVDNSSALFSTTNLQVRAVKAVGSNSLVRLDTRSAKLPQTPEQFGYDPDGNPLQSKKSRLEDQQRLCNIQEILRTLVLRLKAENRRIKWFQQEVPRLV